MDLQQRSRRFGKMLILWVLLLRLAASGAVEAVASRLIQPNIAAILIYLETGRYVRFSASTEVFAPHEAESPPPQAPEVLPVFSRSEASQIELYNTTSLSPDLAELLARPLSWDLRQETPTVLILHTHSTESYTKTGEAYVESGDFRTLDEDYNMLSIGARVAEILAENGITAIQDRALHDYPSYNGSYEHARAATVAALEEYPDIQLVLDLHRDALEGENGQLRPRVETTGGTAAQLMLVMGTNAAGLAHEGWEDNLSLGVKLQLQLERQTPGITRPITLRTQRFNQDLSPGALLIEVGAAGNTHQEALLAAEALANAIVALANGTE